MYCGGDCGVSFPKVTPTDWMPTVSSSTSSNEGLLCPPSPISAGACESKMGRVYRKIQLWWPDVDVNVFCQHVTGVPLLLRAQFGACSKQLVVRFVIFQLHAGSSSSFQARLLSRAAKSFSSIVSRIGVSGARVRRLMMYQEFRSPAVAGWKHFECDSVHWNCQSERCWDWCGDSGAGSRSGRLWL